MRSFGFKKKKRSNSYIKNALVLHDETAYGKIPRIEWEVYDNREIVLSCGGIKRETSEIWFDTFNDELDTLYDLIKEDMVVKE